MIVASIEVKKVVKFEDYVKDVYYGECKNI